MREVKENWELCGDPVDLLSIDLSGIFHSASAQVGSGFCSSHRSVSESHSPRIEVRGRRWVCQMTYRQSVSVSILRSLTHLSPSLMLSTRLLRSARPLPRWNIEEIMRSKGQQVTRGCPGTGGVMEYTE